MGSGSVARLAELYPDLPKATVLEDPGLSGSFRKSYAGAAMQKRFQYTLARNNMTFKELVEQALEKNPKWGREEIEYWAPSMLLHHPASAFGNPAKRVALTETFAAITCSTQNLSNPRRFRPYAVRILNRCFLEFSLTF